jgi:tRNA(adenine34) deaminase
MGTCLDAAEEAAHVGDFPNGACVVVGQDVVAVSRSETADGTDPTAHAEIASLRKAAASGRLSPGATLFTTLEPCAMCLHSAAVAGVREIVFACRRSDVGDAAYVSNLDATTMAEQLLQPLLLTHHGDPKGRVAKLVTTFLGQLKD